MHKLLGAALAALLVAMQGGITPIAHAQDASKRWPQRSVRFILPFGAGSSTDIIARILGERLQTKWDKPVVVENRPGGDGILSITSFTSSADDHVFFFAPTSVYLVHPYTHATLPYDAARDLAPIVRLSKTVLVQAAPASLSANNLKEFIELARANPGKMNYGQTPGFQEFVFDGFLREQGLSVSKIPYRDIVQASTDLAENRIQILGVAYQVVLPQLQAGRVKLLGISDRVRSELSPETPSVAEQGFPTLESVSMVGVYGQPSMSLELRKQIAADFLALVADPAIVSRMKAAGQGMDPAGPEAFAAAIAEQHAQVAGIATRLGITRK
jgi:tripartite-type tricarboxylate transporter receptor subunit TctC